MRTLLTILLVLQPWQAHAAGQAEYEALIRRQMGILLQSHFFLLGKDHSDLASSIAYKLTQRRLQLFDARTRLLATQGRLESAGADGRLLREAALAVKEADGLKEQAAWDAVSFGRLDTLRTEACNAPKLEPFEKEFDAASAFQIRKTLDDFNESIKKVSRDGLGAAGQGVSISLSVNVGSGAGSGQVSYVNPKGGGAANNYGEAAIGTSTAVGATIGSAILPGIGTVIGAVVGAIVGCVLVGIFTKSPRVQYVEKMRDEFDSVIRAVEKLRGSAVKEMIGGACRGAFEEASFRQLFTASKETVGKLVGAIESDHVEIHKTAERIETLYKVSLDTLARDHVPAFLATFDAGFEAYLARERERSDESRKFGDTELAPVVARLLDAKTTGFVRVAAQEALWDRWLEGDTRFTRGAGFSFRVPGPRPIAVPYWEGATAALLDTLEEGR